jgi:hypothetical protein
MSEKNKAIFEKWERIVFGTRRKSGLLPPSSELEWQAMWDDHMAGSNLAKTNISDAALICTLGWTLAVQRQDYRTALTRINRWFEHADCLGADPIDADHCRCCHAAALLLAGDQHEAISEYSAILRQPCYKRGMSTIHSVRNHLRQYSLEQPAQSAPSEEFSSLVKYVVGLYPGKKRLSKAVNTETASYGELVSVLEQTYPPDNRFFCER